MQFGRQLKEKIDCKEDRERIGEWAFSMYFEHMREIDSNFREVLLTLNNMELGYQFYFTYEELSQIANDLIAGKEVYFEDADTNLKNSHLEDDTESNKTPNGMFTQQNKQANCQLFQEMLDVLVACKNKKVNADGLLVNINNLVGSLSGYDQSYKKELQEAWADFAIEYAFCVVEDRAELNTNELQQFNDAACYVEQLIKKEIDAQKFKTK